MNINNLHELFVQQNYIFSTDSRSKMNGGLFFALKGENFNGNKFAHIALENGAAYAIIDEPQYATNNKFIVVENVLKTLQQLAKTHRQSFNIPVIGITGTNGKTTTKELVAAVLQTTYNTLFTEGNFNNHIGVPLTLLRLRPEHQVAIIEMGANHPGEIRTLAEIACPTCGLITNVGKAHLEGFGSLEGVIATKGELYQYIRLHNGTIFANENNQYLRHLLSGHQYIKYGINSSIANIRASITKNNPYVNIEWENDKHKKQSISSKLIGQYNAENILAAVAIGLHLNISPQSINNAIDTYTPTNSRSELRHTAKNILIVDAYNANPTSMNAALSNFNDMEMENKAVILGDMRELGSHSEIEHRNIIMLLDRINFKQVILVGEEFAKINNKYTSFPDVDSLIDHLTSNPITHHAILIKGSNGTNLRKCIDSL